MSFLKKILWHEYGIKVKTIRLHGNLGYWGDKYYLPYYIAGCSAGSTVELFNERKVYGSIESILEAAKKGELK